MKKRKKIKDYPKNLRPYICHGVSLDGSDKDTNWQGDCPYCGKENHFYVNSENGMHDCKVCGEQGNIITFLSFIAESTKEQTSNVELNKLATDRGSTRIGRKVYNNKIPLAVLKSFDISFNGVEYLIPIKTSKGSVKDIRRYTKQYLYGTAGVLTQLGGQDRIFKNKKATIFLLEGEWDAVAMQWLISLLPVKERKKYCVAWVPGANIFKDEWVASFKGRHVVAIYDNDRAGDAGQVRCYQKIADVTASLNFVKWPASKPDGYDTRDYIVRCLTKDIDPEKVFDDLMLLTTDTPKGLDPEDIKEDKLKEQEETALEVASIQDVISVFKKHILMNKDMEDALKVVMAVCLSNEIRSDPLWLYLIGPPGAGKTLILSCLQDSKRCKFVSTISAHSLVSGWIMQGGKDPSLIPKLKGKTFVAKDFTEVLALPPAVQDEIFSTLRGAYDGSVQRPFGNGVLREYKDCYFSMVAGVTNAVHGHGKASLGERFLKFQLPIPRDQVANDIVEAAIESVGSEKAMADELQEVAKRFLARTVDLKNLPKVATKYKKRLTALVQLIAVMRAQVSRNFQGDEVLFRPVPESGTRLAKQLIKLGMMIALVEDKTEIDDEVFRLIEKTAYDTAYGFHLDVIECMMELGGSATKHEIMEKARMPRNTLIRRLDDLAVLNAVVETEYNRVHGAAGGRPAKVYAVSSWVQKLYLQAKDATIENITEPKEVPKTRRNKKKAAKKVKVGRKAVSAAKRRVARRQG